MKAIIYKDDTLYRKGNWQLLKEDGCSVNPFRGFSGFPSKKAALDEAQRLGLVITESL